MQKLVLLTYAQISGIVPLRFEYLDRVMRELKGRSIDLHYAQHRTGDDINHWYQCSLSPCADDRRLLDWNAK